MKWKNEFDKLVRLEESRRFDTYKAERDGEKLFIKEVTDSTDEWSVKSIDKEKQVYDQVELDGFEVPELRQYIQGEMICTSWIEMSDIEPNIYNSNDKARTLIDDYAEILSRLGESQEPSVDLRWPNDDEFYYRMTAEVDFNNKEFSWMQDLLSTAKSRLKSELSNNDIDRSIVHGDMFNPNICFDSNGRLTGLIDWEISGYFDPMYDMAFVEAANLELMSQDSEFAYNTEDTISRFRNEYGITESQRRRLRMYKLWPYYVIIASIDERGENVDDYMPYSSRTEGLRQVYELISRTVDNIDGMEIGSPDFVR